MKLTRVNAAFTQELDILIAKSTPWALSSPSLGNPTIHDFVKGLILSTNVLDVIDGYLPNGLCANWGQVIDDKDENTLSKECDVIIYKGKPLKTIKNKRIHYVLVGKDNTKIVIQVRSGIQSVTTEIKDYCKELKRFVPKVWFVTECCWAKSKNRAEVIRCELKNAGYDQFFYFYLRDYDSLQRIPAYHSFVKFIQLIRKIK